MPEARPGERLIIGAMSGTSADGVDAALVSIAGRGLEMSCKLIQHHHIAYDPDLRAMIFAARSSDQRIALEELAHMGRKISLAYVRSVNDVISASRFRSKDITAIAAHGQTLFHDPPNTIQWLDPSLIASETGIQVVSDFRRADCAAGGQGAPLVPFADYILFRHPTKNRVLLNIGGIANLTYIPAGAVIEKLIAFDTGPGNCVIDYLMRRETGDAMDRDGRVARQGNAIFSLVKHVINSEFYLQSPPRSTDGPAMIASFENAVSTLSSPPRFEDLVASAVRITADTIFHAIRRWIPERPDELFISGGGVHNPALMGLLTEAIRNGIGACTIDQASVPPDAKEAVAFALLAAATLDGVPSNVPSCTGAKRAVVLGSITPKP